MCTTCRTTLTVRTARALRSIADEIATVVGRVGRPTRVLPSTPPSEPSDGQPDVRMSAAALMLEVVEAGERMTPAARHRVECALREEFGLDAWRADRLLRSAERARQEAPGLWTFTNALVRGSTRGQRALLARLLEQLVDGQAGWQTRYTLRRVASLLRVETAGV